MSKSQSSSKMTERSSYTSSSLVVSKLYSLLMRRTIRLNDGCTGSSNLAAISTHTKANRIKQGLGYSRMVSKARYRSARLVAVYSVSSL